MHIFAIFALLLFLLFVESGQSSNKDDTALALNVYHEARGEPLLGQAAVAAVTLNRLKSKVPPFHKYRTIHEVVYDGGYGPDGNLTCQFQWTCDSLDDAIPHQDKYMRYVDEKVVPAIKELGDFSCVLYYHADDGRIRGWIQRGIGRGLIDPVYQKIGNHLFFKAVSCND